MMTARHLAELVLQVLDTQATYFKTRDHGALVRSKELEAHLRREANNILSGQGTLDLKEDKNAQTKGA